MASPSISPLNSPQNYLAPSLDLPWEQDVIALRRDFHAHPELGFEEFRTSGIVAARLKALGLQIREKIGGTGVVGVLEGAQDGPCVFVRAHMDALPVREENGWEWKSQNAGKMHACGHDAHTAIGLSVARILAGERENLAGKVVFMFQPAEEGLGGAAKMITDGLLDDPKPDFALALHVWSDVEVGKIAVSPGAVMAFTDEFHAKIIGKGGHGAMPHQTTDAILVAAHIVTALQSIVSRNNDPLKPGVVTVGELKAGSTFNVIPGEAILSGTVRAFDEATRAHLERRVCEIFQNLPPALGAKGEIEYKRGFPATVNDVDVTNRARTAFQSSAGEENVLAFVPTMGAEDMSLVLEKVPGCYFFVGGRNAEIDAVYPHHHPKFNVDERCLTIGADAMCAAVRELLK